MEKDFGTFQQEVRNSGNTNNINDEIDKVPLTLEILSISKKPSTNNIVAV